MSSHDSGRTLSQKVYRSSKGHKNIGIISNTGNIRSENYYYYYYISLAAFFQDNLGKPAPER